MIKHTRNNYKSEFKRIRNNKTQIIKKKQMNSTNKEKLNKKNREKLRS